MAPTEMIRAHAGTPLRSVVIVLAWFVVLLLGCLAVHDRAYARWKPEYEQQPQDIQNWFASLQNRLGEWCCANADGWQPNEGDISWDMQINRYRVNDHGAWVEVPDYADLAKLGIKNKVGRAMVWLYYDSEGEPRAHVRCFLAGPEP